jgi:hypothetical protein
MLKVDIRNYITKSLKVSGVAGSMIGLILGGNQLYDLYKKKSIEDLSGWWKLEYTIKETDYNPHKNITIAYKVHLTQNDENIKGDGEKYAENNVEINSKSKVNIEIEGRNFGDSVILNIKEKGKTRATFCETNLKNVTENILTGNFKWTASNSRGTVTLEKE